MWVVTFFIYRHNITIVLYIFWLILLLPVLFISNGLFNLWEKYVCEDSSFIPPLIYAMMGSSRDLAVGTVAVGSLLMGSMLANEVNPNQNPQLFLHLAFTATFFAGILQASLGFFRWVIKILINTSNTFQVLLLPSFSKLTHTAPLVSIISNRDWRWYLYILTYFQWKFSYFLLRFWRNDMSTKK